MRCQQITIRCLPVVATYRDDLSDIERGVAAIRLQHDLAAVIRRLKNVSEAPSSYWLFGDKVEVVWIYPLTGKWQRRLKVLGHLHITLLEGCDVRVRVWGTHDLEYGWWRLTMVGCFEGRAPTDQVLSFPGIFQGSPDGMVPRKEAAELEGNLSGEGSLCRSAHGGWVCGAIPVPPFKPRQAQTPWCTKREETA